MKNGEGYLDPTAGKAIHQLSHIPDPIWEVIKAVRQFVHLTQLRLVKITLENPKSKKKYTWRR